MIITKTPLRVSFFGGGSDIPAYYQYNEGVCVSTTINRFIYLAINECQAKHIKLSYSNYEVKDNVDDVNHPIIRETLKRFGIKNRIEISSFSDIPHAGTGLGSSSSFTVGLVDGLCALQMDRLGPTDLAETACDIEILKCGSPIGKQDQYAAAFGGFNSYTFTRDNISVKPVNMYQLTKVMLQNRLYFFNTGITRNANVILKKQSDKLMSSSSHATMLTFRMVEYAKKSISCLELGRLDDFGDLLNDAWQLKRQITAGITNEYIDTMYDAGIKAGALGGKLLGAGGGGYMMFYVPENKHCDFAEKMINYEWAGDIHFTDKGSKVTYV